MRLLNTLGWLYLELGGLTPAFDLNQRSAEIARRRGDHEVLSNAELNLGDAFLVQGDLAAAWELFQGVHRIVKNPATSDRFKWRYSTHLFASLGEHWLARGELAKARDFTEQCLEIAKRTNSKKYLVKGWRLKGQIALASRQQDEAERWLQQALTLAETIGNPTQLWKTHLALGQLHAESKRPEVARQAYSAARVVVDDMKLGIKNPDLRANLDGSPIFRYVYELSPSG